MRLPRIGVSASFFHADADRPIFRGKTLVYAETSLLRWIMEGGATAWLVPPPCTAIPFERVVEDLDGLVLQGGSDICPRTYGEEPLRPEWAGDAVRDAYEIALVQAFRAANKPVLGVCRGMQLLNVALGGTLFQDIATQVPGARVHRNADIYDRLFHEVEILPNTGLSRVFGAADTLRCATVNSVHHQAIKSLAKDLAVEARSIEDGLIEAVRLPGSPYLFGVQWHPEFQRASDSALLDPRPILGEFLAAAGFP
jgi:putative glutamine amidotransferase